jgi:hypothetical protein
MKKIISTILISLFLFSCVSTRSTGESRAPFLDARVKQWIQNHNEKSTEKLPIIVKSDGALKGYAYLKLIKENFYGGHVSYKQLKSLVLDRNVVRIYAGKQKLKK